MLESKAFSLSSSVQGFCNTSNLKVKSLCYQYLLPTKNHIISCYFCLKITKGSSFLNKVKRVYHNLKL
ncbi:hypothetical protein QVD17_10099 [Tagetes erecta]|uniref:Uncharacterized protein n=1 Tax=Tagetes erecta TaxID=13708 RepID=A0AAD8L5V8_TARER|nr:hypothetical protein QVD17_10099 [Tagetes erecta]